MPPEIPDWYLDWVKSHRTTFGLHTPEASAAFAAWWPAFRAMSATASELGVATLVVLNAGPAPMRLADHYQALRTALGAVRDKARSTAETQRAALPAPDRGVCADGCGDTGYVTVPHPRFCSAEGWRHSHHNAAGNPVYVTAAVTCRCAVGRRSHERQQSAAMADGGKAGGVALTLSAYEDRVNSSWRSHMEYRDAEAKSQVEIDAHAKASFEDAMRTFAASTAMPARSAF